MKHTMMILVGILCLGQPIGFLSAQTLELQYSTYLGGSEPIMMSVKPYDEAYAMVVDSSGNAYLTGYTKSADFPTLNPYQGVNHGSTWGEDAFITKLNPSGNAVIYSTYLGGSGDDRGDDIAIDNSGNTYVTGWTGSVDFPTSNAYQPSIKGNVDAFVVKLGSAGNTLPYSTYLGSSVGDYGNGIAVDSSRAAYVTGYTSSFDDFPVVNPYQASGAGYADIFISKISSSGSALSYSTFVGGTDTDLGQAIVVSSGNAYVTGRTTSTDFPLVDPYQDTFGGGGYYGDTFIIKMGVTGDNLEYSTYLGGSSGEMAWGIVLDDLSNVYITGFTASIDFPMKDPYQGTFGGGDYDAFVSKLGSSGSTLIYSSYLGGGDEEWSYGIAIDSGSDFYITGQTLSTDFPTINPYQSTFSGNRDAFITRFDSSGAVLVYSSYFGGTYQERSRAIEIGPSDSAYIAGFTFSTDLPVRNAYQASGGGSVNEDAFIARFRFGDPTPSPEPTPTPGDGSPPWIYDYNGDGTSDIAIFRAASGLWAIRGITRVYFGGSTDEAVPADYDGDGTTDLGIYRAASGLWAIRGVTRSYFGSTTDCPEPADYNGDGISDLGIFRESSGLWAVRGVTRVYFGSSGDFPVPGYYDGDGTAKIGLFRGSTGLWAIRGKTRIYFGGLADDPVPGNYDGSGDWGAGIYRSASGLWAIRGVTRIYYGGGSDWPIPGDFRGNGIDYIGIYRGSTGLWAIRGVTRVYFGSVGDIPVTR